MKEQAHKFLFMADVHVKARTWNNTTVLQDDSYVALQRLRDNQLPTGVRDLVVAGDWFDGTRPSANDVQQTIDFLARFHTVYCIAGNHDHTFPYWLDALHPTQVVMLHPDRMVQLCEGVYICGVDWCSSADNLLNDLAQVSAHAAELPAGSVLYCVLHNGLKELLGIDGTYEVCRDQLEMLCPGICVRYLIGHVHTRQTIPLALGYIHSPGSLYPVSSDKMLDSCSVSLIHSSTGGIEDICTDVRDYHVISADTQEQADSQLAGITTTKPLPPFVLVRTADGSGLTIPASRYPDLRIQIRPASAQEDQQTALADDAQVDTLEDAVRQSASYDDDISDMAVALLNSDDPTAEMHSWLETWKVDTIAGKEGTNA